MRKSVWISLGLVLGLGLWMGSGYWAADSRPAPATKDETPTYVNVAVVETEATRVQQEMLVQGQIQAQRTVELKAETSGRIVGVPVAKGTRVTLDELVVSIAVNERRAKLREAEALVIQRAADLKAARKLEKRQLQSKNQVAEATALYEAARAYRETLKLDLAHTQVLAPFDAIVNERHVEIGDFVDRGDPIAELVDDSLLKVAAHVTQHDVNELALGVRVNVELITGQVLTGELAYVAAKADAATRSFLIEVHIPNPEGLLGIGMSAAVRIPTREESAHFVALSTLTLSDRGEIGIKTVDDNNLVQFFPVQLVRSQSDGAWVSGLPPRAQIIVRGQGFVREGDTVDVTPMEAEQSS
ncbi:MAG: efflux RND transporter periplasmic adaptor subunit [Pseudomonadota bacterium]